MITCDGAGIDTLNLLFPISVSPLILTYAIRSRRGKELNMYPPRHARRHSLKKDAFVRIFFSSVVPAQNVIYHTEKQNFRDHFTYYIIIFLYRFNTYGIWHVAIRSTDVLLETDQKIQVKLFT